MEQKTIKVVQQKLIQKLQEKVYSIKGIARSNGISRNTMRKLAGRLAASGQRLSACLHDDPLPPASG